MTTYLSAGIACDSCGMWPMPDPFNAIFEGDDIVAFICNDCAKDFPVNVIGKAKITGIIEPTKPVLQ